MRLVLADVDRRRLDELKEEIPAALAVRADVSRASDVEALAKKAYARFGAVHLLCNNAGIEGQGAVWEVPLPKWRRVLATNLFGVVHGCVAFVPRMLAQRAAAHVVNTASMAGLVTPPGSGAYSASKHGIVALSEALAQDLALRKARIGVSVLCPGWVATRIASEGGDPVVKALVERGISPESVADETVRAVREDRFYVLTHPQMAPAVLRRAERILEGRAPAAFALRPPR